MIFVLFRTNNEKNSIFLEINIELAVTGREDPQTTHSFSMGDNVEVCIGDLENLQAKIIAIDGYLITVMPKHEDLKVLMSTSTS